jgi:drug/metabolite transporter (DMT)-like permease
MKRSNATGVLALCLIAGSGWLLPQLWPSLHLDELPFPLPQCLHYALIAILAWPFAVARRSPPIPTHSISLHPSPSSSHHPPPYVVSLSSFAKRRTCCGTRSCLALALAGVLLIALPAFVLDASEPAVSSFTAAVIFAAIPLITVLCVSAGLFEASLNEAPFGEASFNNQPTNAMLPRMASAVLGLSGALLLFPAVLPGSLRGTLAFAAVLACAVLAAIAGLWIYNLLQTVSFSRAVALVATANALAFALRALWVPHAGLGSLIRASLAPELLRALAYELPLLVLTLALMRRLDPVRLSARFLFIPLVTVLEGAAFLRISLVPRNLFALLFLAAGGLLVLLGRVPRQMPKFLP